MSGGSKKVTVAYWYRILLHLGICKGPVDALLEIRGGNRVAWQGGLTASAQLDIDEPNLWGGKKKEGGMDGAMDILFGEATQGTNDYLTAEQGPDQPTYRGKVTAVWRGGRFGTNPYPKDVSFKLRRTLAGWDGGAAWYAAKAEISYLSDGTRAPIADDTAWEMRGNTTYKIGAAADAWFAPFHGYIDSLRIKRGIALYAQPSYAVPTGPFGDAQSDPTYANNVLLQRFYTGSLGDEMGHAVTPVNGAALSTAQSRWGSHAVFFNGSNQYLSVAMGSQADLGNAWTMEAWVWLSSLGSGQSRRTIVGHNDGGASNENTWNADGAQWQYLQRTGAVETVSVRQNIPPLPELGRWAFVSICYDGAQYWIHQDGLLLTGGYGVAMNPAHILYDTLTAVDMKGEPVGLINDASFRAAADVLHAEGVGLCLRDDEYASIEALQQQILDIIGGSLSQSRVDGLYYLDLLRPPADIGALPIITADDVHEFRQQPAPGTQELVNQILVRWRDPERNEERTTAPLQALGGIQAVGGVISETRSYPEIPTEALALRIGARDLHAKSTPLSRFELVINRRHWAIRRGTHFRLQLPDEGIADMVCVLIDIRDSGLVDGTLKIQAVQDVFSMPATTYVVGESGQATPPATTPTSPPAQFIYEMPYTELVRSLSPTELEAFPATSSAFLAAAAQPAVGIHYTLFTAGAGETLDDYATGEWCPRAQVTGAATRTTTSLTLSAGERLDSVVVGSWALWDNEIVRVDAIDPGAGTATIARGCIDTVPATHADGAVIWFLSDAYATDGREYTATEAVTAKLPVSAAAAAQDLTTAALLSLTLASRPSRPYPPGHVKFGGLDWPASVSGTFVLDWAHRDRELQADQIIDASVGSIGPADNVRYGLRFRRVDTSAVLVERTDIGPPTATVTLAYTGAVSMELWTIDDDGVSWQSHLYTFSYTPPASPTNTITATPYTPVFGGTIIDGGDLDA